MARPALTALRWLVGAMPAITGGSAKLVRLCLRNVGERAHNSRMTHKHPHVSGTRFRRDVARSRENGPEHTNDTVTPSGIRYPRLETAMRTRLVMTVLRRRQRRRPPRSTAVCAILAALALVVSIAPAAATPSSAVPADGTGAIVPGANQEQSGTDAQAAGPGDPGGEPNEVACELKIGVTEHCPRWLKHVNPAGSTNYGTMVLSPDGEVVFHAFGIDGGDHAGQIVLTARRSDSGSTMWSVYTELPPGMMPGSGLSEAQDIAVSPDSSRVYVGGFVWTGTTPRTYTAMAFAFDAGTGEQLWATTGSELEAPVDQAERWGNSLIKSLAVSPDGRQVYAGGWGGSTSDEGQLDGGQDVVWVEAAPEVLSLDADTGMVEWRHRPNPQNPRVGYWGIVADLVVAPDGRIYAGVWWMSDPINHIAFGRFVVAYDTTGAPDWQYTPEPVHGPGVLDPIFGRNDMTGNFPSMSLSPDGRRLILTVTNVFSGDPIRVFALDTAAGQLEWMRTSGDTVGCDGQGSQLWGGAVVSPDGQRVYFATPDCRGKAGHNCMNRCYTYGSTSVAVVAYQAATGKTIWIARDEPATGTWSVPHALAVNPDGSQIYLAGSRGGMDGRSEPRTMAFDAAGNELWRTDAGNWGGMDVERKVIVNPDGNHLYTAMYAGAVERWNIAAFDTRTADLSVAGAASPEQAAVGEPLTLSFAVANAGPAAAEDVTLTVNLDNRFVSFATEESGSCADEFGLGVVTCELGAAVGSGETATIRIVVTPRAAGTAVTSASVRAPQFDPVLDDNRVVIDTQIGAP